MGWSRRVVGLTYYDPVRAYPGYTLLTVSGGDKVYLIDLEGSIVHQWHYAHGFGECHLLPSGHNAHLSEAFDMMGFSYQAGE